VLAAIAAGADGYLLKRTNGHEIPGQILTIARGGSVLDPLVARRVLEALQPRREGTATAPERLATLSAQERKILALVADGRSNKQIACELQLSEGTIRNYLTQMFSKLAVESRVEAAVLWLRQQNRLEGAIS
jgi:two-component system, NarL family, response regulator DevR